MNHTRKQATRALRILCLANDSKHRESIVKLVEFGTPVMVEDGNGRFPFEYCRDKTVRAYVASYGLQELLSTREYRPDTEECIERLIRAGADPLATKVQIKQRVFGKTVKLSVDHVKGAGGQTALHEVCVNANGAFASRKAVSSLLSAGAHVLIANQEGKYPFDVCKDALIRAYVAGVALHEYVAGTPCSLDVYQRIVQANGGPEVLNSRTELDDWFLRQMNT